MNTVDLTGIPETMLQTVYARAVETKKNRGILNDKKSVDIVSKLDYDFSNAKKDSAMQIGTIARTIVLDKLVKNFIDKNPNACVINIACGLDARYLRVDNGNLLWYDLDLEETINIRKRFFSDTEKNKMIASSVLDFQWIDRVNTEGRPILIIMEGLSMYLQEKDIREILNCFTNRFKGATFLIETMNPIVVRNFREKSIEGSNAKFTWGIKNGKALEKYNNNIKCLEDHSLIEGMEKMMPIYKVIGKIPFIRNLSNRIIVLSIQ